MAIRRPAPAYEDAGQCRAMLEPKETKLKREPLELKKKEEDFGANAATLLIDQRRRAEVRAMLMSEFGIDSVFVGVPKLARILGLASSTIYGYMRRRVFFIPYRMINTTPMVRIDDLVHWYCSPDPHKNMPLEVSQSDDDEELAYAPSGDLDAASLDEALNSAGIRGSPRARGRAVRM